MWKYRSPADQERATREPNLDTRYLETPDLDYGYASAQEVSGIHDQLVAVRADEVAGHGAHCYDPDGVLVCGWPDEHPGPLEPSPWDFHPGDRL